MDVLDLQSKVAQWFPPSQSVAKLDQNQIQIEVKILNNRKKSCHPSCQTNSSPKGQRHVSSGVNKNGGHLFIEN